MPTGLFACISISSFLEKTFLRFGHNDIIISIAVLGILFHRHKSYDKALCFLCFSMIVNQLLKSLFKIPLFPHLGKGYAFPSGHMHSTMIFYGYILSKEKDLRMKIALAFILLMESFCLVYLNFHNWNDVLGAIGFALIELAVYQLLREVFSERFIAVLSIALSIVTMLSLRFILHIDIKAHVWMSFYVLCSTLVCIKFFSKVELKNLRDRLITLIVIIPPAALVHWSALLFLNDYRVSLRQMEFLFFPPILFISMFFVQMGSDAERINGSQL
jgi:undecaprenyl-diphosphatase